MHKDVSASRERISRRRALGLGGTIGFSTLLAACGIDVDGKGKKPSPSPTLTATTTSNPDLVAKLDSVGSCSLTQAEMQGPYWFDVDSIRSDIRENRPGMPLKLALRVYDEKCDPIPNSVVEVWHCDAGGIYSGYEVSSKAGGLPTAPPQTEISDGSYSEGVTETKPHDDGTYLRGAQVADANGIVQFSTIFPGWYIGRTVHIHFKVHVDKNNILTSQLYFDDELCDKIFETSPYDAHPGRDTRNAADMIFHASNIIHAEKQGDGYFAYANLGVNLA